MYSSGSGAFLGETSKHVIQLSLPQRNLCGMDAGIKILLFHEELQGLCLMMGYDHDDSYVAVVKTPCRS